MKKCSEKCSPVEQTRGELGAGDYYDVIAHNARKVFGGIDEPEKYGIPAWYGIVPDGADPAHCVELNEANRNDFRICCSTCGRTTHWGAKDIPGMPDAGADWMRKFWDEKVVG